MTLYELLDSYRDDQRAALDGKHLYTHLNTLVGQGDPALDREVKSTFRVNPTQTMIWLEGNEEGEPDYMLNHSPRKVGRPKERAGDYERITLEIRKDLLDKIDASGKGRREYIEQLLQLDES